MLFKVQAFQSPGITSPEKLYSLNVLDGLNEQQLPLKDELSDDFILCQVQETACGVALAGHLQLSSDAVRYPDEDRRPDHRLRAGNETLRPPRWGC